MYSRSWWFLLCIGLLALGAMTLAAPVPPPEPSLPEVPAGQVAVLTSRQPLRYFISWRWPAIGTAAQFTEPAPNPKALRWVLNSYAAPTALPDPAWMTADFDDVSWSRQAGPLLSWLGYPRGNQGLNDLALLCTRGRFTVADPAKAAGVSLTLSYRGGVVVYLNGTEVGRGNLPAGKIEPLTLAEDYPAAQFLLAPPRDDAPAKGNEAEYLARVRTVTLTLPAPLLRKGTNVVAVEVHRTAYPAEADQPNQLWSTAGLVTLQVTAPEGAGVSGAATPTGVQVWNADPFIRPGVDVATGDPQEPLRPIAITGARNSIVNGQVAVTLPADGPGCAATMSELTLAGGGSIPASAVQVRYVQPGSKVPGLLEAPAPTGVTHPIWLTVAIPKTARAGEYRGELTIATPGAPTKVPVSLTVVAWTLPDRAQWTTDATFLQSAESVARKYNVPLWSDEHFRYLEKSLALLGYAGTNCISIGALAKDIFGADPAIVFVKDGNTWKPDFRYAERYLSLYAKYAPAPRVLSLQVWNYSISGTGNRRDSRTAFSVDSIGVLELRDGQLVPATLPGYMKPGIDEPWKAGKEWNPESEAIWRQVVTGAHDLCKKLGWTNTEVMLGTSGDDWPIPGIVAMFKAIDPTIRWRVATHGSSVAKWGETDAERTQGNGMVVGWGNLVRRITTGRGGPNKSYLYTVIKRDGVSDAPADYFTLPPLAKAAGYTGITNRPMDYWMTAPSQYVGFGNITPHGPSAFITPGPDGALDTPQVEMIREGMQLNEAVAFILATLADPAVAARMQETTASEARQAISTLYDGLEVSRRFYPCGSGDSRRLVNKVYAMAAAVAQQAGQ